MKPKNHLHSFVLGSSLAAMLTASSASAATLFWSGNGTTQGGGGTWNTSTARWGTVAGGPYTSVWNNANNDTAEFNSATGTITLGTGVTVGRINAKTGASGNTIAEGAGLHTITFGVAGGIINNSANADTGRILTVNAKVTGTNLTIQGPGTTAGGAVNLNRNNTLSGTLAITNTTLRIGDGGTAGQLNSGSYANTISVGNNARFFYGSSLDQTLGGIISGAGTITKNSSDSVLTFTANNTYTGTTTISQGILQIGNGGTTGTLGNNSNTSIAAGAELRIDRSTDSFGYSYSGALSGSGTVNVLATSRFNFNSSQTSSGNLSFLVDGLLGINTSTGTTSVQLGDLSGSGQIQRSGNAVGAATLVIGGKGTSTSYSGNILSPELSVQKVGAGSLTLTNSLSYGGTTTVTEGTLALGADGTINNTSGVVLGGGTFDVSAKTGGYSVNNLSGNGTVIGGITVSSGLSIGASPGTIGFESLTLGGSATFTYELTGGAATADLGNVSDTLTIETGAILDLVQLGTYTANDKFTLFAYQTGNLTGTFSGLDDGAEFTDAGGIWKINYADDSAGLNGGTGTSFVTVTAIPETSAALLGGLGALLLLRRRRA